MVSWFRNEFGHHEQRLAEERSVPPEELFYALVRAVPPGSDGLVLQPYWSPGLKLPGPEARGAVTGFGGGHTRAHLYEASGLGAAIDAAVGLGLHPDFETATREMTRPGAAFEPRAQAHAIYDELYGNVYEKIYRRLKPLYEAIRNAARKV